jgi:surface antigen
MTPTFLRLAAVALLAGAASAAGAQSNIRFLKDAPIEKMTREDHALLLKTSNEALTRNADGETSGWTNPKTGASGTVTPVRSLTRNGMKCREAEYTNHAGGLNGGGKFVLCRVASGEWKLAN